MNQTTSNIRQFIRTGLCLAVAAVALWAGKAAAFQAEDPDPDAPPIDYKALEQPPRGGILLGTYLRGISAAARSAKHWQFYERDIDGDGWLSAEEAANDDPAKTSPHVQNFRRLDLDKNGVLSGAEYAEPSDSKLEGDAKTAFEKSAKLEFAMFDRDEDEKLSFEEFCFTPPPNLSPAPKFRRLDADHDGRLTCQEFLKPYRAAEQPNQRMAFYNWDADNDQQLGLEELMKRGQVAVVSLKNEYLARDADGDGRMSRAEFFREALGKAWENDIRKQAELADVDGDGFFSLLEFAVTRSGRSAELFALRDTNGDGFLNILEFLALLPKEQWPFVGRDFYAADLDADGRLNEQEFVEHRQPVAERRTRPDPLVALATQRLEQIAPACQAADGDKDGRLSAKEWPQAKIDRLAPELTGIPFADWDRDKDGFVTDEEQKGLVELAFGVALPGGHPLRKPGGQVFGNLFFQLDANKDGVVSREECVAGYWEKEKNAERFKEWDQDDDGVLTMAEATAVPQMFADVYFDFFKFDADLDGGVTQNELDAATSEWVYASVARLVAAFDLNADRALQLNEYLLSPKANPYAASLVRRTDADNDGRISWDEYYAGKSPAFYGLSRYIFGRYDRNSNGYLSLAEFDFVVDFAKAPAPEDLAELERPPQGAVTVEKWIAGVPESDRSAKQWQFYERDFDGDGWLSEEEAANNDSAKVSRFVQRFRQLDADKNGVLSRTEYVEPADSKLEGEAKTAFEKSAKLEFAMFDGDEDETLSFEEYCRTPPPNLSPAPKFRRLDTDHDGRLTCPEFLKPYRAAEQATQRMVFYKWDADSDQQLGLHEFLKQGQGVVMSLKNEYLARDANGDGKMSREEFEALGQAWETDLRKQAEEYDLDGDGFLSLVEFAVTRQGRFAELFGLLDQNGDGFLTLVEFAKPRPKSLPNPGPIFFATDVDADGRLSLEEFVEQEKPETERRTRPDPLIALARRRLEQIAPACRAADGNKDGRLSAKEWPQAKFDGLAHELTGIPFAEWDRDKDGFVTEEERKELVELAFAVSLPGGLPLRKPGGIVLGTMYFDLDKDKDGGVSRDEFIAGYWNKEKSAELFKEWDKDSDGKLTFAEATAVPEMFTNVCVEFLNFDADFDGRVTQLELDAGLSVWDRGSVAGMVAAFDLNADRGLQFDEYLLCPRANACAARLIGRKDADDDGRLSWDEFHADRAPLFYALSRYFFRRYDRNGNGVLSLSEFDFVVDLQKAPPPPPEELAAYERPQQGAVTLEKFIAGVPESERSTKQWRFYEHDFDGDGLLSDDELAIDDPARVSPHVLNFRRLDIDRDGALSRTEYVELAASKLEGDAKAYFEKSAKLEFAMFDRDEDETLSFEEFCFTPRASLSLAPNFRRLDADHNGRLTCLEFITPYSPVEKTRQRITFYKWDADNDQQLALYEVMRRGQGVVPSLKNEFLARDANDDGKLSRDEYVFPALGQAWEADERKQAGQLDVDGDGTLSLLEFAIGRNHHFEELFALQDADGDGSLSFLEYRKPHRTESHASLRHPFHLADLNADGRLSLEEFLEHKKPGNETGKRIRPDALVVLAEKRLGEITAACRAADVNKDGRLSAKEWPQARIDELAPELAGIPFADWDRNKDGFVTAGERKELAELAFGIALPGGHLLRKPGGYVLGTMMFTFDKDKDGAVSRSEFIAAHWDQEKKADLFKAWDQDGDGKLTLVEATAVHDLFGNAYDEFFRFDRDLDGRVTQEELDAVINPWEKETVEHLVSAFDLNGDGALQLDEYLLSPRANPYAAAFTSRTDADNNGWLSWEEYYPGQQLVFYGLLQRFFDRFDLDHDGFLSLSELDFKIDANKAAPEAVLMKLDRNGDGKIAMDDLLDPKLPDANNPAAVLRHGEQALRLEEAFHIADADGDGALSAEELGKHQALVMAAVEGRSVPVRATRASADSPPGSPPGVATGADANDFRMMAIVGFNVLLLGSVVWIVIKRM